MSAPEPRKPSRRERLKPLELVGLSALVAVFVGLVVLLTTRDITLAAIFLGAGFIVALVAIAMLGLALGFGADTERGDDLRDWDRGGEGH